MKKKYGIKDIFNVYYNLKSQRDEILYKQFNFLMNIVNVIEILRGFMELINMFEIEEFNSVVIGFIKKGVF